MYTVLVYTSTVESRIPVVVKELHGDILVNLIQGTSLIAVQVLQIALLAFAFGRASFEILLVFASTPVLVNLTYAVVVDALPQGLHALEQQNLKNLP